MVVTSTLKLESFFKKKKKKEKKKSEDDWSVSESDVGDGALKISL